jgi:hypothetical protein
MSNDNKSFAAKNLSEERPILPEQLVTEQDIPLGSLETGPILGIDHSNEAEKTAYCH